MIVHEYLLPRGETVRPSRIRTKSLKVKGLDGYTSTNEGDDESKRGRTLTERCDVAGMTSPKSLAESQFRGILHAQLRIAAFRNLRGGWVQLSTNPGHDLPPNGKASGPEHRQRQRLILALVLFLSAIGVVLYKNRTSVATSEPAVVASSVPTPAPASEAVGDLPAPETEATKKAQPEKHKSKRKLEKSDPPSVRAESYTPIVSRKALPPLEVEVFAGGRPVPLKAKQPNAIHVDTSTGTEGRASSPATDDSGLAISASDRVRISPEALQVLSHPVDPNYPLLAREMKVQGSVVLDAVIGRDGAIQTLKIVSGPTILANAAMEAVRQWRFKPYYQEGEAVETEARITVNFTISTT